jgi:glutamate carboxypeptidase
VLAGLAQLAPAAFESVGWQLCCNSSEEVLATDFGAQCRARFNRDTLAALVFEAEGRRDAVRRMVVARKGRGTWRASVAGRAAHAGVKHSHGANAIAELAAIVRRIEALTDPERGLTFNVGLISGGSGLNRVPHAAVAEGEFRAFTSTAYEAGKSALLALGGPGEVRSRADGHRCQVQIELTSENAPWPPNPATETLLEIWRQAGTRLGIEVEGEHRGGLSDGNFLWDAVPTLDGLGPSGDNDHCSERSADGSKLPEFVTVDSFVPKAALNTLAILDLIARLGCSAK